MSQANTGLFIVSMVLPFSEYQIFIIRMQPHKTGFFHLVICICVSSMSFHKLIARFFLALNNISIVWITIVYVFTIGHFGYFQVWALMNKATINSV
jgi:hypothetical protein